MNNISLILCLVLIVSAMNILCFFIGAKIGQKTIKGETIGENIKIKTPSQIVEEHKRKIDDEKAIRRLQIESENIDNYDGTGLGQKDIED